MDELISRKQAIEVVQNRHMMLSKEKVLLINDLEKLPSAQPYTITPDGRLWITVDDIDKVTAVVVDEHKSKFCKQFYEDAQPEIIRCRNCKFASGDSRICMKFGHSPIGELDFCSFAERREVTT